MTETPRSPHSPAAWAARLTGLAVGGATAVVGLPILAACAPLALARGPLRLAADDAARRVAIWESRRIHRCFGEPVPVAGTARAWRFLLTRCPVGVVGAALLALTGFGAVTVARGAVTWAGGEPADGVPPDPFNIVYLGVLCTVLAFTAYFGLMGAASVEARLARRHLGPEPGQELRDRIDELAASRAEVVAAVDGERRRIERDLHDGVQQRLVALGMLIGRARRTPDRDDLLAEAHVTALETLDDLRDVSWRIYPAALDREGLAAALASLAERAGIPVRTTLDVPVGLPRAVETAAYFAASEAVANAVKHSGARGVELAVDTDDRRLRVVVGDDGRGGADPNGPGLTGLRRRIDAVDGAVTVTSPRGRGTRIEVTIPCG